ncbi:hypothetical protein MMC07_004988 [Pseudocyphellaria aurata]|nr:hypothetical protein [Pseudocyphellaria aurata]
MQPTCWALALFAALGASSPVPDILFPNLQSQSIPQDRGVSTANIDYVQYRFGSTNIEVTLFTIKGLASGPTQSRKSATTWVGSDVKSACLLFCADPGADINIRSEKCRGTCRVPALLASNVYITSTNQGIPGDQLIYCPDQAQGVICSAVPPYAVANYGG